MSLGRESLELFSLFKNISLVLGEKPLSWEPHSGLLGSAAKKIFLKVDEKAS